MTIADQEAVLADPPPPDPALRPDPAEGLPATDPTLARQAPGRFEVLATAGPARAARLWTAHGPVDTPCFMPVGTYGAVKGLTPDELCEVGSQIILGNAYHLTHRPGAELVAKLGGLHSLISWPRAILTDSGGFQVFSLRGLQTIDDQGVDYRTHFDGSYHRMTPRSVLENQARLGSDICMVLDHCPPGAADAATMNAAVERTTAWAREAASLRAEVLAPEQLCFGIVQGGTDLELRAAHLRVMAPLPFDGLALGGLSVGEPIPAMHATMAAVAPTMPEDRPRYVMGIGTPADLLAAVRAGVDMFDCVMPTRHARNAQVFTWQGRLNLRWAALRDDPRPIDPTCGCLTCRRFSRAYLRHLGRMGEALFARLATLHNLFFFHQWVAVLRRALTGGTFDAAASELSSVITRHYPIK
ncbi:MAG: tRNA guanosine(34) transglycosylase Tgt [Myxococcales bacterium]|nr:tRNA guanosine(34) transglycosylase Tgt [Myxococcales bacterium]